MFEPSEINHKQWLKGLISDTRPKLHAALSKLIGKDEAEDVTQEAYLKIYELISSGNHIENLPAYLFRVARNIAISRLRHRQVISSSVRAVYDSDCERLAQLTSEESLKQQQEQQLLTQAIGTLPKACRQVFILRKIENKTHSEIAKLLDISPKTVENHITKAIKHCRNYVIAHIKSQSQSQLAKRNKDHKVA